MTNSADPDQLASEEANWSGSTLFVKAGHILDSAELGIKLNKFVLLHGNVAKVAELNGKQCRPLSAFDLGLYAFARPVRNNNWLRVNTIFINRPQI